MGSNIENIMSRLSPSPKRSRREVESRARVQVQMAAKPYWAFVWEDASGLIGRINFKMNKAAAESMFRRTHPQAENYSAFGGDE